MRASRRALDQHSAAAIAATRPVVKVNAVHTVSGTRGCSLKGEPQTNRSSRKAAQQDCTGVTRTDAIHGIRFQRRRRTV